MLESIGSVRFGSHFSAKEMQTGLVLKEPLLPVLRHLLWFSPILTLVLAANHGPIAIQTKHAQRRGRPPEKRRYLKCTKFCKVTHPLIHTACNPRVTTSHVFQDEYSHSNPMFHAMLSGRT